ncbi:hypothetical protein [Limimaricola sp. AA108-03]|uniref:hypothetical protein n=1 Tax=Limimaricola sp. AA108-03 TaxID=3425945 RepID=UPI003D776E9C
MNARSAKNLMEQQVDLVRPVLELRTGMSQHLIQQVLPHLDPAGQEVVREVIEYLDEETDIEENLPYFLDVALGEIRRTLAPKAYDGGFAGSGGCRPGDGDSFVSYRQLTPEEEVLREAMQPIGVLMGAARRALYHAEAVRQSIRLLGME